MFESMWWYEYKLPHNVLFIWLFIFLVQEYGSGGLCSVNVIAISFLPKIFV